jgi:prevent-host-death family protein
MDIAMTIEETVSAAEANRSFSRLLRGVREGRNYLVTSHGRPIARLVPAAKQDAAERRVREAALPTLLEPWQNSRSLNSGDRRATN